MTTNVEIPVEERILQVLRHLGIEKAHFAGLTAGDWGGLLVRYPDCVASLTLVCPIGMTTELLAPIAERLLVFAGEGVPNARAAQRVMESLALAKLVVFQDYETFLFTDVAAERSDEIASTLLRFLGTVGEATPKLTRSNLDETGEVAGITYTIQGSGPPLVLLPLALARSQWEPIIPRLAQYHSVVKLGGAHLGSIRELETRAQTGLGPLVGDLFDNLGVMQGEIILDIGCGSGAYVRELASRTGGKNPITAVDYSPYMVAEALRGCVRGLVLPPWQGGS